MLTSLPLDEDNDNDEPVVRKDPVFDPDHSAPSPPATRSNPQSGSVSPHDVPTLPGDAEIAALMGRELTLAEKMLQEALASDTKE